MKNVHFKVGDTLTGTVSAMDCREITYTVMEVIKKRPLTFLVRQVIDQHRSCFEQSLFGSGIQRANLTIADSVLRDYVVKGHFLTSNEEVQKLYNSDKEPKTVPTKGPFSDPDREYWDYIRTYGSRAEQEKAADYFDVTPSAFEDDYDDVFG